MRDAQDLRVGNTVRVGQDLFLVQKFSYNKGARNASMVKMKLKNLATGGVNEAVVKANEKYDDVVLDHRKMQYLYGNDGVYTFMDNENYEQMELSTEDLGDALHYLVEQMTIEVVLFQGRAVGVELPINVEMPITYTEPAVKGDTSGKVFKAAKLETGFEIQVPLYCVIGEKIKIDTRTDEFIARA